MDSPTEPWFVHHPSSILHDDLTESMVSTPFGPTRLLQIGLKARITESEAFDGVSQVVFIIPGNPGEIHFYRHLMKELYEKINIPIFGVSHVGLFRGKESEVTNPITCRKLIHHKIWLIEELIPADVKVIPIGHSIGAFMAVEMMKNIEDRSRIMHSILMMPAIEHLTKSYGYMILRWFYPVRILLYAAIFFVSCLPDSWQHTIVKSLFSYVDPPECVIEGTLDLCSVRVAQNCLELAQDEFKQLQERDDLFVSKNLSRLSFLYSTRDEWIPMWIVEDLMKMYPKGDITIMEKVVHAFNFNYKMTDRVVDYLSQKIKEIINNNEKC